MTGETIRRNGVALVVGVGDYPHAEIARLDFAAADAEAVAETLIDPDVCAFPREQVVLLTDQQAQRDAIIRHLSQWLPERARGVEIVLLYFAGHGLVHHVGKKEEGFLLPYDADPDNPLARGVAMSDVARWIEGLEAGAVIVCLDCCHAGKVLARASQSEPFRRRDLALRPAVLQDIAGKGRFLLASCDEGQVSVELQERRHGLFTYHLLRGLEGEGDRDGDGKVGVAELFEYVAEAVSNDAKRLGVEQKPWNACVGAGGVYLATPRGRRESSPATVSIGRKWREDGAEAAVREIERQLAGADVPTLTALLRQLGKIADPSAIPAVFRCLTHDESSVRDLAGRVLQAIGREKTLATVETLLRQGDPTIAPVVLDGLQVFEARPDLVGLLDHLVDVLRGDLLVRANQLLEHKRLSLALEQMAGVFRDNRSPYRLRRVLGQGLLTAAYFAEDDDNHLQVVVRVLRPEFVRQPEVRKEFLDRSRLSIKLVHQNLVLTREVRAFPEQNVYYTVRDYIDGVTLREVLAGGRRFDPPQVVTILQQVAEALSPLHCNAAYHGGIKPSNIFIRIDDRVILGDPSQPVQGLGETLKKRLAYDYRYAAPETFFGTAGPTCDFYALGCVAYELFCGAPPFLADHYNELVIKHVTGTVPRPTECCPSLASEAERLVLRLLAKEPAARFAYLADLLEALRDVQAALQPRRRPPVVASSPPSPPPRQPPAAEGRSSPGLPAPTRSPAPPNESAAAMPPAQPTEGIPPADAARLIREASLARYRPAQSLLSLDEARPLTWDPATIPPASNAPAAGEPEKIAIPGYEIQQVLGRGGMGVVYKGLHVALRRVVAIKMIRAGHLAGAEQLDRFAAEAQAAAQLHHPNVVNVYDFGVVGGCPYFSMEYLEGGSLAERLRGKPMTALDSVALVAAVTDAVQHAHEHGILHRDLKPANILIAADGTPKVTDFGLAKQRDSEGHTIYGAIMGTPAYMAPEQAGGKTRDVGPATDIYALGSILYECLTGRPPFRAESAAETLLQVLQEEPVPPRRLQPTVPRDLETVCLKCLQKDPAKRYRSAAEMAEDLRRFQEGKAITARPGGLPERAAKWVRRRPTVKAFLWLCVLATAVGLLVWLLR